MGGSRYSDADYAARASFRSFSGTPTFKHDADIKTGAVKAGVHASLNPHGVSIRESRDSAGQNKVPIGVILDTTGSMAEVPAIIQAALPKLMGGFLGDKASGKKYLGELGYPDLLIGAVDDFSAMGGEGALQVGQFEAGLEIDDNITNLWMTRNGGGTYEESYDLALYFFARHTATDHWEKRGRRGYLFIIGDEHLYPAVVARQVKEIIGDTIQADIPVEEIIREVKERYHLFFVLPRLTQYFSDKKLHEYWQKLIGQQNFLLLDDPQKICELIVGAVAICEANLGYSDLEADGLAAGAKGALVALAKSAGEVAGYSGVGLPTVSGGGKVERL